MMNKDSGKGRLESLRQGSTDARAVEEYYDDWADGYDATLETWQYRAPEDAADLLAPYLGDGVRVLDVGCGTGLLGRALRRRAEVILTGIDISAASLKQAEGHGMYERLVRHDLQVTPLPVDDDVKDIAVSVGVLTYIADAEPLLREMCRAVRPGGVVAFTQRTDLWKERSFADMIDRLEDDGLWQRLQVSAPMPYLPGNAEFADEIGVIHTLCRTK